MAESRDPSKGTQSPVSTSSSLRRPKPVVREPPTITVLSVGRSRSVLEIKELFPEHKVSDLKAWIAGKIGVAASQLRVEFRGRPLLDNYQTLEEVKLGSGGKVMVEAQCATEGSAERGSAGVTGGPSW
eukprot:TRINITY_DN122723_c0_g1_i1.p4 TRINITY_DN122723_c0_g1~~TRINITY_DN122723_c0_g1_i1.p4  ORF type:complete len:128 (+),score=29.44 TRINITY_DN122723_c0_g1_i1:93-476(+)